MENPVVENREWQNFKNLYLVLKPSEIGWIGEVVGVPGCEACGSSLEECQINTLIAILDRFSRHLLRTMEIDVPGEEKRSLHSYVDSCCGRALPSVSITNALTGETQVILSVSQKLQSQSNQADESHENTESRGGQRILSLLELPQEASEAEVYQVVKDLKNRLAEVESRLLQIEIADVLAQNNAYISDMEGFKKLYVEHGKDVAIAFLKVMRKQSGDHVETSTVDVNLQ